MSVLEIPDLPLTTNQQSWLAAAHLEPSGPGRDTGLLANRKLPRTLQLDENAQVQQIWILSCFLVCSLARTRRRPNDPVRSVDGSRSSDWRWTAGDWSSPPGITITYMHPTGLLCCGDGVPGKAHGYLSLVLAGSPADIDHAFCQSCSCCRLLHVDADTENWSIQDATIRSLYGGPGRSRLVSWCPSA